MSFLKTKGCGEREKATFTENYRVKRENCFDCYDTRFELGHERRVNFCPRLFCMTTRLVFLFVYLIYEQLFYIL